MQKFIERYTPKDLDSIVSNKKAISTIRYWAKDHKKPLFIYGAPGIGKTLSAKLIAKEMGWSLYHTDASDIRDKNSIQDIMNVASTTNTLFSKKRLILIDEVDGIADKRGSSDYGSFSELIKVINIAKQPIIFIANDPFSNKKVRPIFEKSEKVRFDLPNKLSILKFAKNICDSEKMDYDLIALKELVEKTKNDIRALLLDLFTLNMDKKVSLENIEALGERKKDIDVFKVLQNIFYPKDFYKTRNISENANLDIDMLFAWIEENIPRQYKNITNLTNALEILSRADIFKGRIKATRWILLKYIYDFLTVGIAYSKEEIEPRGYTPFVYPSKIQRLSKTKKSRNIKKSIVEKIKNKTHCSKHIILRDYFSFIKIIAKDKKYNEEFIKRFGLDIDELKLIGIKISNKEYKKIISS